MVCKNCDHEFHHCSSCAPEICTDNGFCSIKCWESSKTYKELKSKLLTFYGSLNQEQKNFFKHAMIEDESLIYMYYMEEWLNG